MKRFSKWALVGVIASAAVGCAADQAEEESAASAQDLEEGTTRPRGVYEGTALPQKVAYLTFDDGPGAWTAKILETLRAENVKATFFVCAHANDGVKPADKQGFAAYRGELLRMLDDGHVIGNHTAHHKNLGTLGAGDVARELDDNENELSKVLVAAGRNPYPLTTLRPPYGAPFKDGGTSNVVGPVFGRRGINVLWNVDSSDSSGWVAGDWLEPARFGNNFYDPSTAQFKAKVQDITNRVVGGANGNGIVVLMHDIHATTRDALPGIIRGLKAKGYAFRTAEDLSRDVFGKASVDASPECQRFGETNQEMCGRIRDFWHGNGGLGVFGFPTAPTRFDRNASDGRSYHTQWFERNRLEIHPENPRPYHVLLGRLGAEALQKSGRGDFARVFPPEAPRAGCRFFDATTHNVCDQESGVGFKTYWETHGLAGLSPYEASLSLFGLPLSDAHDEDLRVDGRVVRLRVQWFERARFEWHPNNPRAFKVLLGLLGNELR